MWSCQKCGTLHATDEQRESCARRQREINRIAWAITLGLFTILVVIGVVWNQYAYGDWKCMLIHCRKLVP